MSTIAEQLKAQTMSQHQETEKAMVLYLKAQTSPESYAHLLKSFYRFFAPLEQLISRHIDLSKIPDYKERRKAATLIQDLRAMAVTHDMEAASGTELPDIYDHYTALGALYVYEGSTLGGSHIVQMIRKRSNMPDEVFNYFSGYGPEKTTRLWQRFVSYLNHPENETHKEEIIRAANQTFECLGTVLNQDLNRVVAQVA